jgi:hypothetical protein
MNIFLATHTTCDGSDQLKLKHGQYGTSGPSSTDREVDYVLRRYVQYIS